MKILHLEDNAGDSFFVERGVQRQGLDASFIRARNQSDFSAALEQGGFDFVLVDNGLPGFSSGVARDQDVAASFAAGASDYVLKDYAWQLGAALRRECELQSVNQELEAFSAAVSHDLRAPLRAINAEIDTALDNGEPLPTASVAKVRESTSHMARLIDDLLRLSRISRAELELAPVDLSSLAISIVNRLRASEPHRRLELKCEPMDAIEADPGLMSVVLENLLSNAWKYTARRDITRIELTCHTGADGRSVYCVSDNGAGFDPNYANHLFRPFTRLHDAKDFPGIGIGLATVQRIIQRHGGHISAASDGATGAQFYFTVRPAH